MSLPQQQQGSISTEFPGGGSNQHFASRAFPPPVLQSIPEQYIVDQLHRLADRYWYSPDTTDCTLVVPTDPRRFTPPQGVGSSRNLHIFSNVSVGPVVLGLDSRRGSEPVAGARTQMSLRLHQDYLIAQSALLRSLLSRSSHLDLNSGNTSTLSSPPLSMGTQNGSHPVGGSTWTFHVPPHRVPRLLPSSPNHPIILLPLPDPTSFPHIIHYLYFGRTNFISESLASGLIRWESVVRNVEYLGLRPEIKTFLGNWYREWNGHGEDPIVLQESDQEDTEDDSDSDDNDRPMRLEGGFPSRK